MKKLASVFVIGILLFLNQAVGIDAHTTVSQEKNSVGEKRVPAHYKDLNDVKELPKTLPPEKFKDLETKAAYKIAQENPTLLLQLPCYCYCDDGINHKSLLSCYIDEHAAHCDICMKEAIDADRLQKEEKLSAAQIRERLIRGNGNLALAESSAAHGNHLAGHEGKESASLNAAPAFALKDLRGKTVKGLQILGVTYEPEKATTVKRIAQKFRINYPLLFGTEELSKQYNVLEVLPVTIVVDREGKIQSQILGMIDSKDVEEKIAPLLNEK
jgi:hypothetical protein